MNLKKCISIISSDFIKPQTQQSLKESHSHDGASLVAQMVKNLPAVQETRVQSLGQEDPLEKELATHSSILAWRIPSTEKPGSLQSTGQQRVVPERLSLSLFTVMIAIHTYLLNCCFKTSNSVVSPKYQVSIFYIISFNNPSSRKHTLDNINVIFKHCSTFGNIYIKMVISLIYDLVHQRIYRK